MSVPPLKSSDEWLNPTLLGAGFDAGDIEKASEVAGQVIVDGSPAWKLETILADCKTAAQLQMNLAVANYLLLLPWLGALNLSQF